MDTVVFLSVEKSNSAGLVVFRLSSLLLGIQEIGFTEPGFSTVGWKFSENT